MAKTFNSVAELTAYIKKQQKLCMDEIGREGERVMKETTEKNLYGSYSPEHYERTRDMINMIGVTKSDNNSVEIEFKDTGGHHSWGAGKRHVYVAPILEEGGHTYESGGGRKEPTDIIKDSVEELKDVASDTYIRVMASKGIKAHKK